MDVVKRAEQQIKLIPPTYTRFWDFGVLNKNKCMSEKPLLYSTCPIFLPRGGSSIKLLGRTEQQLLHTKVIVKDEIIAI